MGLNTWIRDRIRAALVPFGGTVSRPSDNDDFPMTIANEAMGGFHGYRTLEELADLHRSNMQPGMAATVLRHIRGDGTVFERDTYILDPTDEIWGPFLSGSAERISEIDGYDLSLFWKPLDPEKARSSSNVIESQYADAQDYGRPGDPGQPAFQPPLISAENYQAGKKSDSDSSIIWDDEYDPTIHKYERQRLGENGLWGIPKLINATSYSQGDYIDNRFIWVDKGDVPTRPTSILGGKSNSEPQGWSNTPAVPGDGDYYEYIEDHDLYRISASKDTYGNLKSEWSTPVKISTDPKLVRYGNKPSSTNFIAEGGGDTADWRGYYTPGTDTHMATRLNEESESWTITKIDGEDGEYVDWIFKAFPLGYEPDEDDRPTISNPFSSLESDYPNNGWKDAPFAVGAGEVLYRSTGRKYNDGELKPSGWAIPTRADGQDTIQVVIEPQGPANFKRDASGTVTPESIVLKAVLYRGNQVVDADVDIRWYKGDIDEDNEIIEGSSTGISQYHTISGELNDTLTIHNFGVTNSQLYHAVAILSEEDYIDKITILDVTDGIGIQAVIGSDSGFAFKNSEGEIEFNSELYVNGFLIDPADYLITWYLGDGEVGDNESTITIAADDIDGKEILTLEITYGTEVYRRVETLVDITDAKATEVEFSTQDPLPTSPGDQVWTESPTNAVYMRLSVDGGATWKVIRVKGERGSYNGGFQKSAYKNSATQPTASSLTSDLLPTGTGWTHAPTTPGTGEHTWEVTSFFVKNPSTTETAMTSANWTQNGSWSTAIRKTGVDGDQEGPPGAPGPQGWSPVVAAVTRDSNSEVLRVVDWTGGGGTKPSTGMYISSSGYTADISAAKNVKGSQGGDANSRPMYYASDGSRMISGPAPTFSGSTLQYRSGTLEVKNNWSQSRWFRIEAEVPFTNDGPKDDALVAVLLKADTNSWPTSAASATRVDMNFARQDYVADPDFPAVYKIKLAHMIHLAPGHSAYYRCGLALTDGVATRAGQAFIEAWGI